MGLEERVQTRIRLRPWYPLRKIAGLQTFESIGRDNLTPLFILWRPHNRIHLGADVPLVLSSFLNPHERGRSHLHLSLASSDLAQIYDPWLCTSDIYSNLGHRFSFLTYPLHRVPSNWNSIRTGRGYPHSRRGDFNV